jgi:hypothetical protein
LKLDREAGLEKGGGVGAKKNSLAALATTQVSLRSPRLAYMYTPRSPAGLFSHEFSIDCYNKLGLTS